MTEPRNRKWIVADNGYECEYCEGWTVCDACIQDTYSRISALERLARAAVAKEDAEYAHNYTAESNIRIYATEDEYDAALGEVRKWL